MNTGGLHGCGRTKKAPLRRAVFPYASSGCRILIWINIELVIPWRARQAVVPPPVNNCGRSKFGWQRPLRRTLCR